MHRGIQFIIQAGSTGKHNIHVRYYKNGVVFIGHFCLVDTHVSQPFGTRALKKIQVPGVVNHPAGIGIFPVNSYFPDKGIHIWFFKPE